MPDKGWNDGNSGVVVDNMNQAGLQLRAFMQRSLTGSLAWYNRKRVFRLLVKRFMLRIKSE